MLQSEGLFASPVYDTTKVIEAGAARENEAHRFNGINTAKSVVHMTASENVGCTKGMIFLHVYKST